ncbi:hypothetical protein GCM10020331_051430 [Ectobacillus funiculus]
MFATRGDAHRFYLKTKKTTLNKDQQFISIQELAEIDEIQKVL